MGKRGGSRIVYFYHDMTVPLFLLAAFAKNAKADMSAAERHALRGILAGIVDTYRKGVPGHGQSR